MMSDAEKTERIPTGTAAPAPDPEPEWASHWASRLYRTEIGSPLLPLELVASLGPEVRLIDVREPQDFIGPLGYIPGSDWIPYERVRSLPERVGRDSPLVIITKHGERASEVARTLESLGMRHVAAMAGGVVLWRSLGFSTTRDPEILDRCDVLREIVPPACAGGHGPKMSLEDVEMHLGDPGAVRWIKLGALMLHAHLSCIDGRDERGIIGTPGGDAGQFLLALAVIEATLGRLLGGDTVAALFDRRIDALGGFYMHTDQAAFDAASASIRADPRLAAAVAEYDEPGEWRQFLRRPPLSYREPVLDHLCRPEAVGCGHLRLMLQHAGDYGIRAGLVVDFLRAFFHARWEGAFRAEYEMLQGRHGERAVLNARIAGPVQPFSQIPLVSPSSFGCQMFVNHPQVSQYLLQLQVDFLLLQSDLIPEVGEFRKDLRPILLAEIENLSAIHARNSLGHLARGLPIYDLVFRSGGEVRVELAGMVA